jgi:hypothetical protein
MPKTCHHTQGSPPHVLAGAGADGGAALLIGPPGAGAVAHLGEGGGGETKGGACNQKMGCMDASRQCNTAFGEARRRLAPVSRGPRRHAPGGGGAHVDGGRGGNALAVLTRGVAHLGGAAGRRAGGRRWGAERCAGGAHVAAAELTAQRLALPGRSALPNPGHEP